MRVRELAVLSLSVSVALAAAGCAGSKRAEMANAEASKDVKPSEYSDALGSWTRESKVYAKLETRLIVNATYRSGAFREAYVDEYARRYLLASGERDDLRRRELNDAQTYHEFFFAAYTVESRWNDFSKRSSMWRLRLFDDKGASVEPLVVTRVKQDDPVLHAFYPYFSLWTRGYVVKFPREGLSPDSKTLRLQLTSAIGAAELEYARTNADREPPVRVQTGETAVAPAPAPAPSP